MSKIIEKDQGTIDSLLHEGHQDNHPFLRVLYNTNGYNEYWNDLVTFIQNILVSFKLKRILCKKFSADFQEYFYDRSNDWFFI